MSLHGNICINHIPIGTWVARRKDNLESKDQTSTYECYMAMHRTDGSIVSRETELRHRYSDGAVALAVRVLTWAQEEIVKAS